MFRITSLTKKHFKAIAEIIKECGNIGIPQEDNHNFNRNNIIGLIKNNRLILIKGLSDYFKTQNPLFNEKQFKKVCLE